MKNRRVLLSVLSLLWAGMLSAQDPPRLVVREHVIDLGTRSLSQGDTTVVFHYKNEGDSALVISRVAATCTCVVPEFSTEPLQPGDSATLSALVSPYHSGRFSKALIIVNNSPETLLRVSIRGQITD